MLKFALNDSLVEYSGHPGLPALDFLRDQAGLLGVKHACREGDCGSCVILIGRSVSGGMQYRAVTSCLLPTGALHGQHVVTVEGLNPAEASPFQTAIETEGGSQCGFCTPGFVVSFAGYLLEATEWSIDQAVEAVAGNICRCTGYSSIIRAMETVIDGLRARVEPREDRIPALIAEGCLPDYFLDIAGQVPQIPAAPPEVSVPAMVVISGGTDLYVQRPDDLDAGDVYVLPTPSGVPIRREDPWVYLAGTATAEDLKQSQLMAEVVGDLSGAMTLMGSLPIRNRATIAGNIVNASPIGDMTIILLALDSEIGLINGDNRRHLPLNDFFLDYKKLDLQPGELVEWLRFRAPGTACHFNFEKVSKRTYLDIATVNTAISLRIENDRIAAARVAAGGVAPVPMQLQQTSAALVGKRPTAETAAAAARIARSEVSPISDVRGSAQYKSLLLGQLMLAHFNTLFDIEDFSVILAAS